MKNKKIENKMKLSRLIPSTTPEYRALRRIILGSNLNFIDVEEALNYFKAELNLEEV